MTTEEQAAQRQHAEEIRQRTAERQQTPEDRQQQAIRSLVQQIAQQVFTQMMAKFTINAGQGITVSGTGLNVTVSVDTPPSNPQGGQGGKGGEGIWTAFEDCTGDTFEVLTRNFIPPA